jgi:hypothetical protein
MQQPLEAHPCYSSGRGVINTIINDGILEKCRETGRYFREKLGCLKINIVL